MRHICDIHEVNWMAGHTIYIYHEVSLKTHERQSVYMPDTWQQSVYTYISPNCRLNRQTEQSIYVVYALPVADADDGNCASRPGNCISSISIKFLCLYRNNCELIPSTPPLCTYMIRRPFRGANGLNLL